MELAGDEIVIAPAEVPVPAHAGWVGAGGGWNAYGSTLQARIGDRLARVEPNVYPRARFIAELGALYFKNGKAVPPEQALPVYVRDNVAKKATT